eukprot:s273_g11.t1
MRGKAVTFVLLASMCCFIVGIVLFFWPVTPAPPTEASAAGRGFFRHGAAWAGPAGPTKEGRRDRKLSKSSWRHVGVARWKSQGQQTFRTTKTVLFSPGSVVSNRLI